MKYENRTKPPPPPEILLSLVPCIINQVQMSMQDLAAAGLGIFKVINKLKIFYKMLPSDDLQQKLAQYNISVQDYRTTSLKDDDKLTASNIFTMSEGHPFKLNSRPLATTTLESLSNLSASLFRRISFMSFKMLTL